MYTPSREQFRAYAEQGYDRIPVVREILSDLETPVSAFLKLAGKPRSFLLESVEGGEKWGRYSILGLPAREWVTLRGGTFTRYFDGRVVEEVTEEDPLGRLRAWVNGVHVAPVEGLPRFAGGAVGYFSYDTVRYIEAIPEANPDPLGMADAFLVRTEQLLVFDNLTGKLQLIQPADPGDDPEAAYVGACEQIEASVAALRRPLPERSMPSPMAMRESDFHHHTSRADFEAGVERAKEYIRAGDIMQVVLSQRFSVPFSAPPFDVYRALRTLNPSPYMYFLDTGEAQIVGSSPEILVRLEGGRVTVRPIAGTRRRGRSEEEDRYLEQELLADPKERAEHLMLLDLARNDVGRVSVTGTVAVDDPFSVERYSHVMHMESNVAGHIRPDCDAFDALRAALPAGTLSGAPKVRAMEIIEELEGLRRGVYGGAVGHISHASHQMDTAIAIRTAVIKDGWFHVQSGAGIVADSDPATEYEETMSKSRALFRAAAMAAQGLETPSAP
ncbi:anthranilate synthase component I [Thiohalorhabdus methylotrophus]|uniref:Anthranilate synthase component 1 n=1 Tax=Thiohalorhabdus methylotrophus TaxID=3242694 RepID=A0ABV4TQ58_9GAMM